MPISISMYYPNELILYSAKNTNSELFLCRGRGGWCYDLSYPYEVGGGVRIGTMGAALF